MFVCQTCGRPSIAKAKPRHHVRRGERCGPFAEAHTEQGPRVVAAEPISAGAQVASTADGRVIEARPEWLNRAGTHPFTARQSLLRALSQCGRRTRAEITLDLPYTYGYSEATADLGSVMHAVADEILRTLYRQGEVQMPTEEAINVMREVYAASPIVLPSEECEDLVWLTLRFVERTWRVDRLLTTPEGELAIEQQIAVPLMCPDGVERTMTVTPDALFAGSGASVVAVDYKSGKGKPKAPRTPQEGVPEGVARGMEYLSTQGHYQALCQGLGILHRYPACQTVYFREYHLRSGQIREAILTRDDLEHARQFVAIDLMKLDGAIRDGEASEVWKPRPGSWCQHACPVQASCPVPVEMRGRGAIAGPDDADATAAAFVVIDAQRDHLRELLKVNWSETGRPARIGDGRVIAWDGGKGGAFEIRDEDDQRPLPPEVNGSDVIAGLRQMSEAKA